MNGSRRVVNCEEDCAQVLHMLAKIVNIFASRNQRRMHFINPLDD